MSTRTASHGLDLVALRAALRPRPLLRVPASTASRAGWLERLALWSERQPVHHRLGSWERIR